MSSVSSLNSLLSGALPNSGSGLNLSALLQAATGASSEGIDVTSAVSAALYADRAPERQWQSQQSTVASQITALTSLQTALGSVSNDLNDLNSLTGSLTSRTALSSSTQVTATAAAGTDAGTHTVSVQSLATDSSWYSPSLSGSSSSIGTSTLTITSADGTATTLTAGSGINSLTDLARAINASSLGVNASVVSDAFGSRLALVSASTGSSEDFTVSYGASGASTWSSASLPSASTTLTAGSFQVGDGTNTATINIQAGDTLAAVAANINALGEALTASVVTDSSGAHLQIAAGANASVSISSDPTFSFTRASTASNASLTVDGIPVNSASNTV
ncbi:MAG TPA: flagellar cap protein FliD N-terminal domain-containing protein, partial [Gemmatimonadaceae bacterium]